MSLAYSLFPINVSILPQKAFGKAAADGSAGEAGLRDLYQTSVFFSTLLQKHCNKKQEIEECILKLCGYIYHQGTYTPCGVSDGYPDNTFFHKNLDQIPVTSRLKNDPGKELNEECTCSS